MLSERVTVRILVGVLLATLAAAVMASRAEAFPPPYTPTPAGDPQPGLVCKVRAHRQGFTRVCASVHVDRDGNTTFQAAGAVAAYDRRFRPVARPLAVRVVLVGDRTGLRRACPLTTTRRARLGPRRVVLARTVQARVLAFEYRDHEWKQYLVYSGAVRTS